MYGGNGVPKSMRSDVSDQEEDEESDSGPVAISEWLFIIQSFHCSFNQLILQHDLKYCCLMPSLTDFSNEVFSNENFLVMYLLVLCKGLNISIRVAFSLCNQ